MLCFPSQQHNKANTKAFCMGFVCCSLHMIRKCFLASFGRNYIKKLKGLRIDLFENNCILCVEDGRNYFKCSNYYGELHLTIYKSVFQLEDNEKCRRNSEGIQSLKKVMLKGLFTSSEGLTHEETVSEFNIWIKSQLREGIMETPSAINKGHPLSYITNIKASEHPHWVTRDSVIFYDFVCSVIVFTSPTHVIKHIFINL